MADDLDPKKYHVLTQANKLILGIFIMLVLLIVVPLFSFSYYTMAINRPSQTEDEITYEITKGMGVSEIAAGLYERGAINSEFLFNLYVFLNKVDRKIQAGVYVIPAGTSIVELTNMFQLGKNDTQVTFLEGWRIEEYAREAAKVFGNIDYQSFVEQARGHEGYLFPDTYIFNKDIDEEEMINYLSENFEKKTAEILTEKNLSKSGISKEQAVIMASIVEREARNDEERPVIAGILLKRLKEGIKLDADATVQYTVALTELCPYVGSAEETDVICAPPLEELLELDWWPNELTQEDLEYPSNYNTRLNTGLPPAPISSMGLAALEAVVESEETDYYFYLHDPQGNVHYAVTVEEHEQNVMDYLR